MHLVHCSCSWVGKIGFNGPMLTDKSSTAWKSQQVLATVTAHLLLSVLQADPTSPTGCLLLSFPWLARLGSTCCSIPPQWQKDIFRCIVLTVTDLARTHVWHTDQDGSLVSSPLRHEQTTTVQYDSFESSICMYKSVHSPNKHVG